MRTELDDARRQYAEQCQVSNVVLTHPLDEMVMVTYRSREMCVRVDWGQEMQLVYNYILSVLGVEEGGVNYVKLMRTKWMK